MKLSLEQKRKFYKMLSFYTSSNLDLITSLKLISRETKGIEVESIIEEIQNGRKISEAFEAHSLTDEFIKANLNVGENIGNYSKIYEVLSEYLEKRLQSISSLKRILIYPAMIFTMMIMLIGFIIMFATPQLYKVYQNMDISAPKAMKTIMNMNVFLSSNSVIIRWSIFTILLMLLVNPKKQLLKQRCYITILKRKWFRKLYVNYHTKEITWQLYNLLDSNLDIIEAFSIIKSNAKSAQITSFIGDVLNSLEKGECLSSICDRNSFILGDAVSVYIKMGEHSGDLISNIKYINLYASKKFGDFLDITGKLLPPALILLMGIFMVGILMIIMPLLDVSNVCSGI